MTFRLAVIGQGYVGLPLAVRAALSGIPTKGIDVNAKWVDAISKNPEEIEQVKHADLQQALVSGRYSATTNPQEVADANVVAICVPTPLDEREQPDLTYLIDAINGFAPSLKPNTLVILESTSFPGTMREVVIPKIVEISGLSSDQLHFAFSPERIDPGNTTWDVQNTPKIVSGANERDLQLALAFYSTFMENVVSVKSLEVAEMAKLLENTYRQINISFINEFARHCQSIGVSVWDVIEAAATKPFGFTRFNPGVGIGGHCIPVDPQYLNWKLHQLGANSQFIELASRVNHEMPEYVASRALDLVNASSREISCLVIGISYKANVADIRESPSIELIKALKKKDVNVSWHDKLISEWNGEKSAPLSADYDVIVLVHQHESEDLVGILQSSTPIFDCTGKYRELANVTSF